MEQNEIRWKQRFANFEKAYKILDENIDKPLNSDLEKAGLIQFFEIAFELSWKVMKDYLESLGIPVNSPREAIKKAFQSNLLNDGHIWLDALSDRNLTVHTYDEKTSNKIINEIKNIYFPELKNFYKAMQEKL